MKKFILLVVAITCLIQVQAQGSYKREQNISYYTASELVNDSYKSKMCQLDIYYPTGIKDFPTIVWFHGGGLTGGTRDIPKELIEQGVAVVTVGYRLSPEAHCPAYIEDAAAATAWAFNNIAKYGGNPSKIYISGHSAGGYLGMMIGMDKKWLGKYGIDANRIAALIPLSGQAITHFTVRKEMGISDKQPLVNEFAPLFHVRKDLPPLHLITGGRDTELLGRYEENAYLWRMMKEVGHSKCYLYELNGFDHGGMVGPGAYLLLKIIREQESKK